MEPQPHQAADTSDRDATALQSLPLPSESGAPALAMGPYRLLQRMGGDNVASIYRGYDASLDRPVAIRVLSPEGAGDKDLAGRFQAEATVAAGISHPNVVAIHFVGQEAGRPYYVMHFVEGDSLASRLSRQECLPSHVALKITAQCLAGLEAAHQRGIVHGGLHPGKILLEEPSCHAMLNDLGRLRHAAHDTRTDLATVLYTPPELAHGAVPDARSDLYAMGVVLFRMLAGRMPFEVQSPADVLYQITYGTPLPLEEAAPNVPEEIRTIVRRLMARDPGSRYQSASEALADVHSVCTNWEDGGVLWAEAVEEADGTANETLCQSLDRLAGGKLWQRAGDWAATMFRRHAPEFLKELHNTTQQADGAIAACQRRCDRLLALLAEGEQIGTDLPESSARAAHEEHLAALRAELSRVQETLDRLRLQRDVLLTRLKMAQRGLQGPPAPRKLSRRAKVLIATAAGLLSLLVVQRSVFLVLAWVEVEALREPVVASLPVVEKKKSVPIILPTAPPADLMSQNVVYFTFEPDTIVPSGPYLIVKDLSGREQHGVLVGPRQLEEGLAGTALVFPEGGLRIDIPTLDSIAYNVTSKPFSVSVWIRQSRYTQAAAIFGGLARLAENRSIVFEPTNERNRVEARDVSAEQWHHLVGVWDVVSTSLYVDGRLAERKLTTGNLDKMLSIRSKFSLGSISLYGDHAPGFIGLMDEFALFERPLFEQEVQTLYRQGIQGQRPPLPAKPISVENYWTSLDDYCRDDHQSGLSLDGKTKIEIGYWGRIRQTDVATGDTYLHPQLPADGVAAGWLSFSSDSHWAAILGWSGTVSLWDLRERKISREFHTPLVTVYTAAFSPDMAKIAIGGKVRAPNQDLAAIGIWDLANGEVTGEFRVPAMQVRTLAWSPDGERLLVVQRPTTDSPDLQLCLLRADDGRLIRELAKFPLLDKPRLRWLPDNVRILVNGPSGTVRLFDVDQGREETLFSEDLKIHCAEPAAGGRIVIGLTEDRAILWDVAGNRELEQMPVPDHIDRVLSLDPKTLTLLRVSGGIERVAVPASIQAVLARMFSSSEE